MEPCSPHLNINPFAAAASFLCHHLSRLGAELSARVDHGCRLPRALSGLDARRDGGVQREYSNNEFVLISDPNNRLRFSYDSPFWVRERGSWPLPSISLLHGMQSHLGPCTGPRLDRYVLAASVYEHLVHGYVLNRRRGRRKRRRKKRRAWSKRRRNRKGKEEVVEEERARGRRRKRKEEEEAVEE
ncbi:Tic22-like family [Musa troglodytarum]|uniref:Tic22-like family n=1 Tax=Musa troglodytarum TaxID=320322 RepID=A0A9E7HEJ7_9LILI|nr:Tic22-like family [Musa troglodytarum]